jgi:hypothetical protein
MASLDGRDDLSRRIERIDRRLGLIGHLFGLVLSFAIAYVVATETEKFFGRWAFAAAVVAFLVAGYLFNRDFDRD